MNQAGRRLNMLAVDDEMGVLKVIREVFSPRGWNVISTPTGMSVQAIVSREKLDIILLDIRLPDIDGLDVLKWLKNKFPAVPVIIYTAYGYEDELVNKALRLGATGYVSKNVPIHELIEVVNNTLVNR